MRGDLQACDSFDVMGRQDAITAPTLVIGGTNDPMTPLKFSRYLAEHIASAELVIIEGSGHMVVLERPGETAVAVARLLNRVLR
jgi:pimeloyl-ACP methyl ester carboxylesterase